MGELPAGPYRMLPLPGGGSAPWYIAPFDRHGTSTGPKTRDTLIEHAANGGFTDIFVFSHGWNNTWEQASRRYEQFIAGYGKLREDLSLPVKTPYEPLLVGIFWPSIDLVLPWERGPRFAAQPDVGTQDARVELEQCSTREIAEELAPASRERFYTLAQQDSVDADEARELAQLLVPQLEGPEDELADPADVLDPTKLVSAWAALPTATTDEGADGVGDDWGTVGGSSAGSPGAAFSLRLDPRDIVRAATVWKMKDRSGVVGSKGVAPLLRDLHTAAPRARMHLIGHSYGCRLLLAAVSDDDVVATAESPAVDSMLLLQPAVNFYCFADQVPRSGKPGGYRNVLSKVRQPVLTTFSSSDSALHDQFHWAVRRKADVGEQPQAAALGEAPSIYCALGGYGPAGMGALADEIRIKKPQDHYSMSQADARVIALRADDEITGHGDITNEYTYWALYNQVGS
jgi:hypothetical protein